MRNSIKVSAAIILSGIALWRCGAPESKSSDATTTKTQGVQLPQDVLPSCTVDQATFNSWFASGTATENGMVMPANSVTFPHQNNCDFYKWSEQMFLWVTSPASGAYGQGGIILESPVFYTVSPVNAAKQRILIPHAPNTPLQMTSGLQKDGPNRLPVIKDKLGRLFEVEPSAPATNARALVKNNAGASVEVDHVQADAKGAIVFMDKAGKPIQHPKAIIQHKYRGNRIVQRFALDRKSTRLNSSH